MGTPGIVNLSVSNGQLQISPVAQGQTTVTADVYDHQGADVEVPFNVIVNGAPTSNHPPVAKTVGTQALTVGGSATTLSASDLATDPDPGDTLTVVSATYGTPGIINLSVSNGQLQIFPVAQGQTTVTADVYDSQKTGVLVTFPVAVNYSSHSSNSSSGGTSFSPANGTGPSTTSLPLVNSVVDSGLTQIGIKTDIVRTGNTVTATVSDIDLQSFIQSAGTASTAFVLNVPTISSELAQVNLSSNQLSALSTLRQKNSANTLVVTTSNTSLALPLSLLSYVPAGSSVQITVAPDPNSSAVFSGAVSGSQVAGTPVSFDVRVEISGQTQSLNVPNDQFVRRSFVINETVKASNAGVLFTENGQVHPVPATFSSNPDGTTTVTVSRPGFSTYAVATHQVQFADIGNSWAEKQIQVLADKFLINGETATTYAPKANLTRAEFTALLVRGLGLSTHGSITFKDVRSSDWYANDVAAAYSAGLIQGMPDSTFHPNDIINRQDMAVILSDAMKLLHVTNTSTITHAYSDASSIANYASEAINAVSDSKIMVGESDGQGHMAFHPQKPTTREAAAMVLYRLLQETHLIN